MRQWNYIFLFSNFKLFGKLKLFENYLLEIFVFVFILVLKYC